MKKLMTFVLILVVFFVVYIVSRGTSEIFAVKDFLTCEKAGYPVMESFPRQCRTPEGTTYVEEIKTVEGTTTPFDPLLTATTTGTSSTIVASSTNPLPPVAKECKRTGCSGQICSDKDMVSTCEYREVYSCYETAVCERQVSGECGWTESAELTSCIEEKAVESNSL